MKNRILFWGNLRGGVIVLLMIFSLSLPAQECGDGTNLAASVGDFESFTTGGGNGYNAQAGIPDCQFFDNTVFGNSPGVETDGSGNQFGYLAGTINPVHNNAEFITIPVGEFSPGCLLSINFKHRDHNPDGDGHLEVWGASLPEFPLPLPEFTGLPDYCSDYGITSSDFVLIADGITSTSVWHTFNLENWVNNQTNAAGEMITITHIIIINNNPGSFAAGTILSGAEDIDDIIVTKPCAFSLHDVASKPNVNCEAGQIEIDYEICLETNLTNPEGNLVLNFTIPDIPGLAYSNIQTTGIEAGLTLGTMTIPLDDVLADNCYSFQLLLDFDANADDMEININMMSDLSQDEGYYVSCIDVEGAATTLFLDCEPVDCTCSINNSYAITGNRLLSDLITNEAWPADAMADACIAIDGQLTIDVDGYNIIGGEIKMEAGSEIIVGTPSVPVTLSLTNITTNGGIHGCNQMWKGIKVSSSSTLIMEHCYEADARYGIWPQANSTINVTRSKFSDNYVGIYADAKFDLLPFFGNTFQGMGGLLPSYSGQIPIVREGQKPYAGIEYHSTSGAISILIIGANGGFPDFIERNTFLNMRNGIWVSGDVTLSVTNSVFYHIQPEELSPDLLREGYGVYLSGNGNAFLYYNSYVWGWDFIDCRTGVRLKRSGVNMTNARMLDMNFGIWVELAEVNNTINLANNTINCKQYGIALLHNDASQAISIVNNWINVDLQGKYWFGSGIKVFEMQNRVSAFLDCQISENKIKIQGGTIPILKSYFRGIDFLSANKWYIYFNEINCNSVAGNVGIFYVNGDHNTLKENRIWGNGDISDETTAKIGLYIKNSTHSTYQCNYFEHLFTGALFKSGNCLETNFLLSTFTGAFFYGLHYEDNLMCNKQRYKKNKWLGYDYIGVAALNDISSSDIFYIGAQQYVVGEPNTTFWPPTIDLPNSILDNHWFVSSDSPIPVPYELAVNCETSVDHNKEVEKIEKKIAENFNNLVPENALLWDSRRSLYEKLKREEADLTPFPNVQNFYSIASSGKLELYSKVRNFPKHFYDEVDVDVNHLLELNFSQQQQIETLLMVDSLILAMPSEGLFLQRVEILEKLKNQNLQILEKSTLVQNYRNVKVDEAISLNNNLLTDSLYEFNEKILNNIYFRTIAKGNFDFTEAEKNTILAIALQCPMDGGRIVHQARSLYFLINPNHTFLNDCTTIAYYREGKDPKAVKKIVNIGVKSDAHIQIFPNPANRVLKISFQKGSLNKVILLTITGRELFCSDFLKAKSMIRINTSQYEEGVYFLKFHNNKGALISKKIVIQH